MRSAFLAAVAFALSGSPALLRAEHLRAHGTLSLARPFGGFQQEELPWGAGLFAAAEMPLLPQLGPELELGTVLLGSGDPPSDPSLEPQGGAHAIYGAVGVHVRPFVTADPTHVGPLTGIWASVNAGATTTGGLFRGVVDAHAGYDFLLKEGRYGIGPALGLVHVFQSNGELRPDDANIAVLGVHVMFDSSPRIPPDTDGDGIVDRVDRCPLVAEDRDGFQDRDGCPEPDNDADGLLDPSDHCPFVAEDKDGFEDEDGCPEADNDRDEIPDAKDRCPDVAEDFDDFEDEDGCPDPDNDQDDILDRNDLCPDEPETRNEYADEDGCPDEDQVRVVGQKIVLDDRVHFEQNNSIIRPMSFPLLERLSKLVREHPEYVSIEVQGHTDQKGDDNFNQKLSQDRANSVRDFLVKHGVDGGRLTTVGFGSKRLLVDQSNERALYMNRRVEFVITREVRKGASHPPAPAGAPPVPAHNDSVPRSAPSEPRAPAAPAPPVPTPGSAPPAQEKP